MTELSVDGTDDVWFINFYSPQCSHCHELAPAVSTDVVVLFINVFFVHVFAVEPMFLAYDKIVSDKLFFLMVFCRSTEPANTFVSLF